MIAGIFHEGSGLGDQLFRYITVRSLAERKGFDWGMKNVSNFKGDFFLSKQFSEMKEYRHEWNEKVVRDSSGTDIRSYDPEINFIEDNTLLDGSFEDDKYWRHKLKDINDWLQVEPLEVRNKCIVGFRGGEYASNPELFLPLSYYEEAMRMVRIFNPMVVFEVHTDDPGLASKFFEGMDVRIVPNEPISHSKHTNMGFNWRSARFAKYAIIPNSAFFILPRILSGGMTIAPRYWARRNTKTWARPACYYPEFIYI